MAMSSKDGASSVGTLYRVNAAGETVAIHGDDYQGKHFIVDGVVYAGAYDEKVRKLLIRQSRLRQALKKVNSRMTWRQDLTAISRLSSTSMFSARR